MPLPPIPFVDCLTEWFAHMDHSLHPPVVTAFREEQSSFGLTSFVSEVVFLKMPSFQEKKRRKRRAQYLQVRDDFYNRHGHPTELYNIQ